MARLRAVFAAFVVALAVAGCAGESEPEVEAPPDVPAATEVRAYFLRDGKVWPLLREASPVAAQANAALDALFAGPTAEEEEQVGVETAIPDDVGSYTLLGAGAQRGAVTLDLDTPLTRPALAQVVYTLTQFPLIEAVVVQDRAYRRASFEDLTPAILVEWPLALDAAANPIHAFGTANTFEATFGYELTDTEGEVVEEEVVSSTSGSGVRGRFEFVTEEYSVPSDGVGALIVFERSAQDGSRVNVVEIPLRMSR